MKKNSLFSKIFIGFVITIGIFSTVLIFFFKIGLNTGVDKWNESSLENIRIVAKSIIQQNDDKLIIPQDIPIFVYDMNKTLIYSNRGAGRKTLEERELNTIYNNNTILGYFSTPKIHFMDNEANKQFTVAITNALIFAVIISTLLVLFLALFVSRDISKPINNIVIFLKDLRNNELGKEIEKQGTNEIQKIIQAVNILSQELAKEEKLRSQWGRDIAHDLRTPVSALKAQFEGMSRGALDINIDRINQNIKEVERLEYLINDLSDLMKLEDPENKLFLDEIDSSDFISQILNICPTEIENKKIEIKHFYDSDCFIADEMLIYRAVSNIWLNAVRHVNINGVIEINIKSRDNNYLIEIVNSGEVIPPDELGSIFDRLFRGEKARNSKGSGLGLTISKEVVKLHGGDIKVISNITTGTKFTIELPIN